MPPACFFGAVKVRNGWAFSQNRQGTRFFLGKKGQPAPGKLVQSNLGKATVPSRIFYSVKITLGEKSDSQHFS